MIPKIIHYCWFGRGEKPQKVIDCIATWKAILPDYVIKEWNEDNFDYNAFAYTREAYKLKKYAFVSDVARLYALMTEGGIYLDTDVRVLKKLDVLLENRSFIGMETPFVVCTAVIGAVAHVKWIEDFYFSYQKKHFIRILGGYKICPNTQTLSLFLHSRYPADEKDLNIYGIDVFSVKLYNTGEYIQNENTYTIHEFANSWKTESLNLIDRFQSLIYRYIKKY